MLAAWLVGLGAVVWLAATGGAAPERADPTPLIAASAAPVAARALRLDRPARRDELVTTPEIVVRGHASSAVASVRVTLESRGGKILASHWVDRSTADAGEIPFEARFAVTTARPAGVMWVTATALGRDGVPIDALRRRFQLDATREEAAVTTAREVIVRGRVAADIGDVRIVLQTRAGAEIASAAIDPTGHGHADWVPFESRFRLAPDSEGRWPAYIVAVRADGRPIEAVRHPFGVGAYIFIPASSGPRPAPAPALHTTGEDGLMGGIPFGTNFLTDP